MRKIKDLSAPWCDTPGSQRAQLWETQETEAPESHVHSQALCSSNGRTGGIALSGQVFFFSMRCFLFCFVFWCRMCGGEVEYMKCIYNIISPHTFHEDVIFFFFFWYCCGAYGILVPRPGMEPMPSAMGVRNLNPWATREVRAILSLLGASLEKGSALHQRLMCFVTKEYQVSPWTPPLGGQNLNYNSESQKTQHWPLRSNLKLVCILGCLGVAQRRRGLQAIGSPAKVL